MPAASPWVTGSLSYSPATEKGIFDLYGYTAKTGYFAAVGTTPDRRMTEEATVLTIQATMPANKDGTYTLGAEFIAALDGSGDVYTAQVITTPVAITGGQEPVAEDTPVITETNGDDLKTDANTAPDGTSGNGNGAAGGDTAGAGDTANGSGTANDGAAASDGVTGSDAASSARRQHVRWAGEAERQRRAVDRPRGGDRGGGSGRAGAEKEKEVIVSALPAAIVAGRFYHSDRFSRGITHRLQMNYR